jgi:diacylglycerol kinase family enzyme
MRIMLLVNSAASSVTARRRVVIASELSAHHDCEVVETHRRGHAIRLCRDAARRGIDVVVVLGGDGTLNEAANGLVGTQCALAALPGGSTNVFARTLGMSDDPIEATRAVLRAIDDGRFHRIGLGSVNGRHFLFHTGVGWDAVIVRGVERHGALKRYASHPLFIWSGLRAYFTGWDRSRPHFRVSFDDGTAPVESFFTLVMNSDPYTFVGSRPFRVTDTATLDRPLVAVSLLSMRTRAFLEIMFASLRSQGRLADNDVIDERPDLDGVTITADRPIPYQVDGDDMGDTPELRFLHHPEAMTLVDPRPSWD